MSNEEDKSLAHRMIANLVDNELKHLPAECTVTIQLRGINGRAELRLEDSRTGFDAEVIPNLFECRVKGKDPKGHGLGLAFVEAVLRMHSGTVSASNLRQIGARIQVSLPLSVKRHSEEMPSTLLVAE